MEGVKNKVSSRQYCLFSPPATLIHSESSQLYDLLWTVAEKELCCRGTKLHPQHWNDGIEPGSVFHQLSPDTGRFAHHWCPSHQDLLGASLEEKPCLVGRGLLECCYSSGRKKRKHFSVTCAINKGKNLPYSMKGPLDGFLEFSKSLKENPRADHYSQRWQGSRQQKCRRVSVWHQPGLSVSLFLKSVHSEAGGNSYSTNVIFSHHLVYISKE